MQRLDDLVLFLRVLDAGSISAAARGMDLSVAVASQRLKRLESELGVRLFHRTTRRLHATPEGVQLAERGRDLVDELQLLGQGLRSSVAEVRGVLRMTLPSSFGRRYVSPLLPAFMAAHPGLRVQAFLSDDFVDLVESGFDLAIRIADLADSSLVARRLAPNRRVLCASRDYLRRYGAPQTPADLARHNCLILAGNSSRQDVWRLTGAEGEISVRVRGNFESNLGEVLRDAAIGGVGIALKSTWDIGDALRSGEVEVVLPDWPVREIAIHALLPQRRQVPSRVRAFVDYLAARLGDDPPWDAGLAPLLAGSPKPAGKLASDG